MTFLRRLLALATLALLFASTTHAQSQAEQICDGYFERFLKGYTIGRTELDDFLRDDAAIARCRAELDAGNDEHRLVEAFLLLKRRVEPRDDWQTSIGRAQAIFAESCARGRVLACVAPFAHDWAGFPSSPTLTTQQTALLQSLLPHDLPVVNATLGAALLSAHGAAIVERRRGAELLRRATLQGDWWAPEYIAYRAQWDPETGSDIEAATTKWRQVAARLGNTLSASFLVHRPGVKDDPARFFAATKRVADSDPRFFRYQIAIARFNIAYAYETGQGVAADAAQARAWYARAAELGHGTARQKLDQK